MLSSKAYFYYNRFRNLHNISDYNYSKELYESSDSRLFIDHYRYVMLQLTYADDYPWRFKENKEANGPWYWDKLLIEVEQLIDEYTSLSEQEKKHRKREYIRCLYNHAAIIIDHMSPDWDLYYRTITTGNTSRFKAQLLCDAEQNLLDAFSLIPQGINKDAAEFNPGAVDIHYRLSQVYLAEGLTYILYNKAEKSKEYFEKSIREAKEGIGIAHGYKAKGLQCKRFDYIYSPMCKSLYILGKKEEAYFRTNARYGWQWIDIAQMHILDGEIEKATECLLKVDKQDKSFTKAERLLKEIGEK